MNFVDVAAARDAEGLRLVVAGGIPSPWSEAAKSTLAIDDVPHVLVRGRSNDELLQAWLPGTNFPVALYGKERPRTGWAEILELAERLSPSPSLVPSDPTARVTMFGLSHEILGEGGLCWSTRVRAIGASLATNGAEGFPLRVAQYLAGRYGFSHVAERVAKERSLAVLRLLDAQLRSSGGPYFFGGKVSALDLHSVAALGAIAPLSEDDCPMLPIVRPAFEWMRKDLGSAVPEALLAHRDRMFKEHLALPMTL